MTCREDYAADASAFFNAITGLSQAMPFLKVESATVGLKARLLELIENETERQKQGQKGLIRVKVNSLSEPDIIVPKEVWKTRYESVNAFEKTLHREGTTILKFFLHISKDEQKKRLQARLDDKKKLWKFNPGDLPERRLWSDYRIAYEEALSRTSTDEAPWYIVPADKKWYRNLMISSLLVEALEALHMEYPKGDFDPKKIVID